MLLTALKVSKNTGKTLCKNLENTIKPFLNIIGYNL